MKKNVLRKEQSANLTSFGKITFLQQTFAKALSLADSHDSTNYSAKDPLWEFLAADPGPYIEQKQIKELNQSEILNKINYLHFTESSVSVFLKSSNEDHWIKTAKIHAISNKNITCCWPDSPRLSGVGNNECRIIAIGIDNGKSFIFCSLNALLKNDHSFIIRIPEKAWQIDRRSAKRYFCFGIKIGIRHLNKFLIGQLADFNTFGIKIRFPFSSDLLKKIREWNGDIEIFFLPGTRNQFSATYKITRQDHDDKDESNMNISFTLTHKNTDAVGNQPAMEYRRNPRLNLMPAPHLSFRHPLLRQNIYLKIDNISSSGICVCEEKNECILIPGLIIPRGEIIFNNKARIICSLKTIYHLNETGNKIRWGLAIIDIHSQFYAQMMQILTNALDPNVFLNSKIDSKTLWEFFFDADFIYEKKYNHLSTIRKSIKNIYNILYQRNPEIAMHLTYQKDKLIYGHFSALHAYEDTWIQHHHAAKAVDNKPIGFLMLKHLIHYFKDLHRFPSLKANYLMGYFRPENKFPQKIFGGFYNYLSDRKKCSMDLFAYIENNKPILFNQLPKDWTLRLVDENDLTVLTEYYEKKSGGLLLEALGIEKSHYKKEFIEALYRKNGFFRRLRIYALYYHENIQAVLILEQSNSGLNLSDLLNHIKIILLTPEKVPWKILSVSVFQLIKKYQMGFIPILIFPVNYVTLNNIQCNKHYQLWVCKTQFYYKIIEYLNLKFRFPYWS